MRKNRYPDVTIGVSPIQVGSRVAEWELMFEVNIPLARESRRAQESEALALAAAARARKTIIEGSRQALVGLHAEIETMLGLQALDPLHAVIR